MYTKEKPDENVKLSNDERWLHRIYQNAIIKFITPETVLWLQKKSLYTVRVWLKYQWNLVKSSCFIKDMFSNNTYTYNAYSTFLHYLTLLFLKRVSDLIQTPGMSRRTRSCPPTKNMSIASIFPYLNLKECWLYSIQGTPTFLFRGLPSSARNNF